MRARRLTRLPTRQLRGDVRLREARGARARLLGLAFLREIAPNDALLLPGCRSVHTFGMRFPLDVVFLDRRGRLIRAVFGVPSGRVVWCRSARAVVEARAGEGWRVLSALAAERTAAEAERPSP